MTSLRIGCSTLCFKDLSLSAAIEQILSLGISDIEICHVPGFCEHLNIFNKDIETELVEMLNKKGVNIFAITLYPGYLNSNRPELVFKTIKRFIDIGEKIGARYLTIPSGLPVDEEYRRETSKELDLFFKKLAEYAEKKNIIFSVEAPHLRTFAENIDDAEKLFNSINKKVGCTFDTSHVCRDGRSEIIDSIRKVSLDRISYFHMRDVYNKDITITPGRGQVDFSEMTKYLVDNKFDSFLSIELEDEKLSLKKMKKEVVYAKKYLEVLRDKKFNFIRRSLKSPITKLLGRLKLSPKSELKRHKKFINSFPLKIVKWIKNYLKRKFSNVIIFDGAWNKYRKPVPEIVDFNKLKDYKVDLGIEENLKVCIQGCGGAGTFHAFGFNRIKNVKVVGVSDINRDAAEVLAEKAGCNPYISLKEMIESEKPDIVSICTREWQHYNALEKIIPLKIDVFCEKIFVTKIKESDEIVKLLKKNGNYIGFNYNYRFIPGIIKMKDIISSGILGDLLSIHFKVHGFSYHHALDLVSYLGGRIVNVQSKFFNDDELREFGGTEWDKYDKDILYVPSKNMAVIFELEDDIVATIESSIFYSTQEFILSINCTFSEGMLSLNGINAQDVFGELTYTSKYNKNPDISTSKDKILGSGYNYPFSKSIESFLRAYKNGTNPETGLDEAIFNMKLEKAISKSDKLNKGVNPDEIK